MSISNKFFYIDIDNKSKDRIPIKIYDYLVIQGSQTSKFLENHTDLEALENVLDEFDDCKLIGISSLDTENMEPGLYTTELENVQICKNLQNTIPYNTSDALYLVVNHSMGTLYELVGRYLTNGPDSIQKFNFNIGFTNYGIQTGSEYTFEDKNVLYIVLRNNPHDS
jgi:hypothetical protein